MPDLQTLNQDLAAAIGVPRELSQVHAVTLRIRAGEIPQVAIERHGHKLDAEQIAQAWAAGDGSVRLLDDPNGPGLLGDLQRLQLQVGDILVLSTPAKLCDETATRLREWIERGIPGHKCIVLGDGLTLGTLGRAELPRSGGETVAQPAELAPGFAGVPPAVFGRFLVGLDDVAFVVGAMRTLPVGSTIERRPNGWELAEAEPAAAAGVSVPVGSGVPDLLNPAPPVLQRALADGIAAAVDRRMRSGPTTALDLPAPNLPNHADERRAWAELMLPAGMRDPGDGGLTPCELASWRSWAHRAALELLGGRG